MTSALRPALAILRYTLTAFLAVWVAEKFLHPDTTAKIWSHFYLVDSLPAAGSYAIGAVQTIALLAFVLGFRKFLSYGFWVLAHGAGTMLAYGPLLNPYEGSNHLFYAAIPVLGGFIALFLLRKEDTFLTIDQ